MTLSRPAGDYDFWSCMIEADGTVLPCLVFVRVDDGAKLPDLLSSVVNTDDFLTKGAPGTWTWDVVPPPLRFSASYRLQDSDQEVPLAITARMSGRKAELRIERPPAEARPSGTSSDWGELFIYAWLASDPTYSEPRNVGAVSIPIRAPRRSEPCLEAFPDGTSTTRGGRTLYSRQASQRLVCQGFGAAEGMKMTTGIACALISGMLATRAPTMALFLDGVCTTAELVQDPGDRDRQLSAACGYLSIALGARAPAAGTAASIACSLAPSVGHQFETDHQMAIAADVVQRNKCIQLTKGRLGLHWAAVPCEPSLRSAHVEPAADGQGVKVTLDSFVGEVVTGELIERGGKRRLLGRASKRFKREDDSGLDVPLNSTGRKALRKKGKLRLDLKLTARTSRHRAATRTERVTVRPPGG